MIGRSLLVEPPFQDMGMHTPNFSSKYFWSALNSYTFFLFDWLVMVSFYVLDKWLYPKERLIKWILFRLSMAFLMLYSALVITQIMFYMDSQNLSLSDIHWAEVCVVFLFFRMPGMLLPSGLLIVLEKLTNKLWKSLLIAHVYLIFSLWISSHYLWDFGLIFYGLLPYAKIYYETFSGVNNFLEIHVLYLIYWIAITLAGYAFFSLLNKKMHRKVICYFTFMLSMVVVFYSAAAIHQLTVFSAPNIPYRISAANEKFRSDYTELYKKLANKNAQYISIDSIDAVINIFPENETITIHGNYQIRNTGIAPISNLIITLPPFLEYQKSYLDNAEARYYKEVNLLNYRFETPLQPNKTTHYHFKFSLKNLKDVGFYNYNNKITADYTQLENTDIFPLLGLNANYLSKEYLFDKEETWRTSLNNHQLFTELPVNKLHLELITDKSQTALTIGELTQQRQEGDRVHFYYNIEHLKRNAFPIFSAHYVSHKVQLGNVQVTVLSLDKFQKQQQFIADSAMKILELYQELLGSSPYPSIQIVQRPIENGLSRTFPGLVTLSSKIAFNIDLNRPDNEISVFNLVAHELAHFWFGYKIVEKSHPALGSRAFIEGLAQFMSLMAVKSFYPPPDFERLYQFSVKSYAQFIGQDKALIATTHADEERFLTYFKSSLLYYGLSLQVGEDKFFEVLRKFLSGPATLTPQNLTDFRDFLVANLKPEFNVIIRQVFDDALFFDFRIEDVAFKLTNSKDKGEVVINYRVVGSYGNKLSMPEPQVKLLLPFKIDFDEHNFMDFQIPLQYGAHQISLDLTKTPKSISIDPEHWYLDINPDTNSAVF